MLTFRVLSVLLDYPEPELWAHLDETAAVLRDEALLPAPAQDGIEAFLAFLAEADPMGVQALYVDLFDRGRSLSLHLFEHVHGESRDRGQAMVDLLSLYRRHGLATDGRELPDFLPLFLEFLSTRPADEARALLGDAIDVIALIGARLDRQQAPYRLLFPALLALSARAPDEAAVAGRLDRDRSRGGGGDDRTPAALDRAWAEAPVTFGAPPPDGAGGAGCPAAAAAAAAVARFVPSG